MHVPVLWPTLAMTMTLAANKFAVYSITLYHDWICFDVNNVVYTRLNCLIRTVMCRFGYCTSSKKALLKFPKYVIICSGYTILSCFVFDSLTLHRSVAFSRSLDDADTRKWLIAFMCCDTQSSIGRFASLALTHSLCSFEYWAINKWFRHGF